MRTLRLILSYDGTDFSGWQFQPDRRTVQGELENALGVMLDGPVRVAGAGRTDTGVHALRQVASFSTPRTIPVDALERGLNSLLPPDVRVLRVEEMPEGFHARFSAISRTYRYHLSRRPGPIRRRYSWIVPGAPSAALLLGASGPLIGRHLFDAFTSGEGLAGDTSCTVETIGWEERGQRLMFSITADRFLYRMVRTIVGTLLMLHRNGDLRPGALEDVLASRAHSPVTIAAPPNGLFLVDVGYPDPEPATS
jgi:tRNA pseudouridine38-40 synthase